MDEGRFDIGRDGTGIVHEEDERIAFFRVIVLWDVKVVGECRAALRGILEYCLLEILDDEFAHARRFLRCGGRAEQSCCRLDQAHLHHLCLHDGERLRISVTAERWPHMSHGVSLRDRSVLWVSIDGGVNEWERCELEYDIGTGFRRSGGGILSLYGIGARDRSARDLIVVGRHGCGIDGRIVGEDDAAHVFAVARDLCP